MNGRRCGSVLILSLWVVFFLAALSLAIGSHVASVFSAAERLSARVQARAAAAAGAAQAGAVIMAQTNTWDGVAEKAWNRDETLFKDVPLADGGAFSVVFVTPDAAGGAVTNIGVIGEEGKINLNTSHTNLLTALFVTAGGLGDAEAQALCAALVAWRAEGDDERLTAGKESGYPAQTSTGGEVAPRSMAQVEDLLQIKGVDAALFARLRPFLTVHGAGLVNINAAAPAVIEVLGKAVAAPESGGAVVSLVRKLTGFREAGLAFEKAEYATMRAALEQFAALAGDEGTVFTAMAAMLTVQSTAFSGTAFGNGSSAGDPALQVDFVWDRQARRFVMWRER
jgi:type II secretory pathway component PulK